jgi:predicted Zn-dependent peptidase
MKLHALAIAAALVGASSLLSAPPAFAAAEQTGTLPRGGSYILDTDTTVGAAAIGLWFRAPGAGYDNAAPGISRLAATAAAAAPLASGKSLVELVRSVGGVFDINVRPDIVGIDAIVPATAARRVVAAMTAAYFSPSIDENAMKAARTDTVVQAVQQRYTLDAALQDALYAQIFDTGPAHYPPIPNSITQITHVSTADVVAFANRAFRSTNGVLTLSGNVDISAVNAVTDGTDKGTMDAPFDSSLAPTSAPVTATGEIDGTGMAWVGAPIIDEKAATALDFISDYLFREDTGVVSKAVEAGDTDDYVTGRFITLHNPGITIVTIGGTDEKSVRQHVVDALAKLQQPLDAQTFTNAREAFLYHVAADTQTPQDQADNLGWYAVEGNAPYAPGSQSGAYERAARSLDPQYVADVVKRYLHNPVIVNLVTHATTTKESSS